MTDSMHWLLAKTPRRTYRAASLLAALFMMGCSAATTETDDALPLDQPSPAGGLRFASEHDALGWVARRAEELDMGTTTIERDEGGRITKVAGVSIGLPEEIALAKAQLIGELGGEGHTVEIAGEHFLVEDQEPEVLAAAAHCSGGLCTKDESFKNDYYLYRELGSRTSVTSGGFKTQRTTIQGSGFYECVDLPGPLPVTCNGYCNYPASCPSGFTQESTVGYPTCRTTCVGQVRDVTLSISIVGFDFFESSGILVASIPERSGTTHDASLEVKYWEYGVGIDSVISDAEGLCGSHSTSGPEGLVVARSHWGRVPSTCQ
ncbi:hypothetical protein SOCE26_090190 [Sorangium cellulosum]|uniref:Secreted protein n=1 Tax=Sorangium cellulosum TaxID=56 RepID=A0A2L0F7E5_SORCE|nr:hypothetical protein [Sorangium cellulosum]AUX47498.1 hypothetical protein SOCE26_090190 [Sorangium cellulosum]